LPNSISIIMQRDHSIVLVTPQKPLRGIVLSDDRDYVSYGDLRDISKLYTLATESEGKQFLISACNYVSFLLSNKHFKKSVTSLANKKPVNWQKILVLKNVWDVIENKEIASSNVQLVPHKVYVTVQRIASDESDEATERFIRRYRIHLYLVHKTLIDVSGGTAFLKTMDIFYEAMQAQSQMIMDSLKSSLGYIFQFQKSWAQNIAPTINISVAFFTSYQTEVATLTNLVQQISQSFGNLKPFFDSLQLVSEESHRIDYKKSIVSSPRIDLQLATYEEVHEIKEYEKRQALLMEVNLRINNPGITDDHIEGLFYGRFTPAYLAEVARPALQPGSSYTKSDVDEIIYMLKLRGKERILIELLGKEKGHYKRVADILIMLGKKTALSQMVSTLNDKFGNKWKIESKGNSWDGKNGQGYFYRLVRLRPEQMLIS